MKFREATIEDIQQIQIVRHSVKENVLSNPNLVTNEDCKEYLTERGKGWVCEIDNSIAGFAIADLRDNNIWALFLKPEYEGRGIGRQLHDLMLGWYFSTGKESVWLGTSPHTRAEKFYRNMGWEETGMHGDDEIKFEMTRASWLEKKKESRKLTKFRELETARLLLRSLEELDWESISFLRSDETVNRFVKRKNADTKEKALDFIRETRRAVNLGDLFYWSICLKSNPDMIGSICLWNFSADKKSAEVGYDLKPDFQQKGIMSEALQEVLKFGFEELDLEKIEAFTQKNNKSSVNLLLKHSFELDEARRDEENPENRIYALNRR